MKAALLLSVLLVAATASARPEFSDPEITTELQRHVEGGVTLIQPQPPNEVRGLRYSYSGMAVSLVKADNPLQLFNPFAPAEYGSGEANVVRETVPYQPARDLSSGDTATWKFLAIRF